MLNCQQYFHQALAIDHVRQTRSYPGGRIVLPVPRLSCPATADQFQGRAHRGHRGRGEHVAQTYKRLPAQIHGGGVRCAGQDFSR